MTNGVTVFNKNVEIHPEYYYNADRVTNFPESTIHYLAAFCSFSMISSISIYIGVSSAISMTMKGSSSPNIDSIKGMFLPLGFATGQLILHAESFGEIVQDGPEAFYHIYDSSVFVGECLYSYLSDSSE